MIQRSSEQTVRFLALLPANNEADNIGEVLERLRRHADHVLVVDDGSVDGTADVARQFSGVEVIQIPHGGKGGALRVGFAWAIDHGFDWVMTLDSDGQHDPDDAPRLLESAAQGKGEMIIGSRTDDLTTMPWVRKRTNLFMSSVVSGLAGAEIPDTQSGFRLIHRAVLDTVELRTSHFELESEILIESVRRGFRVASVPIRTIYRINGRSHIRKVPDTWRFLKLCARKVGRSVLERRGRSAGPGLATPARSGRL